VAAILSDQAQQQPVSAATGPPKLCRSQTTGACVAASASTPAAAATSEESPPTAISRLRSHTSDATPPPFVRRARSSTSVGADVDDALAAEGRGWTPPDWAPRRAAAADGDESVDSAGSTDGDAGEEDVPDAEAQAFLRRVQMRCDEVDDEEGAERGGHMQGLSAEEFRARQILQQKLFSKMGLEEEADGAEMMSKAQQTARHTVRFSPRPPGGHDIATVLLRCAS